MAMQFTFECPSIAETTITGYNGTAFYCRGCNKWEVRFEMNKLHCFVKNGVVVTMEQLKDKAFTPGYVMALYKAGYEMFIGPMELKK